MSEQISHEISKRKRQEIISRLLHDEEISVQSELASKLAELGVNVTQATLSRDLVDLGAIKRRNSTGRLIYVLPQDLITVGEDGPSRAEQLERLQRSARELIISAQANGMFIVLKTPPAAASMLASVLDESFTDQVMGTIAGDDTVFAVAQNPFSGEQVIQTLLRLAKQSS